MSGKIPERIGLVPNPGKPKALELANEVAFKLKKLGIEYIIDEQVEKSLKNLDCKFLARDRMADLVDMIIVFGGDGTYLHTARSIPTKEIPILGINLGRLGFLTEIEIHELDWALQQLAEGNYKIAERIMVDGRVIRNNTECYATVGLNDMTITNAGKVAMVELEVYIDDEFVNSYPADGLIICTPTGSTAYSLSAGGPIVDPFSKTLIITPICPHTLYSRSIVISADEEIKVVIRSNSPDCVMTIDGQENFKLKKNDEIVMYRADNIVKSVKLPEHTFYKILRNRMRGDRV